MGNFCSGKQAKKEAKLEDLDKPGERGDEAAAGVTVREDGVQAEVKDTGVGSEPVEEGKVKADDGMRVVKDLAKELAKEAEAKALARKQAAEKATIKAEEDARKSLQQTEETAAEVVEGTREAAESSKQDAEEKVQNVAEEVANTAGEKVQNVEEEVANTAGEKVQNVAEEVANTAGEKVQNVVEEVANTAREKVHNVAEEVANTAGEKVQNVVEEVANTAGEKVQAVVEEVANTAGEKVQAVVEETKKTAEGAEQTASEAIGAKQEAEKIDAAMQQVDQTEQEVAVEVAAAKETTQDFVDSTMLAAQAASSEEQSRAAEDTQDVCETASDTLQAASVETLNNTQTLDKKVTEVEEKIVAEAEEAKQTAEITTSAVNEDVIKCVQAVHSEAEAAISQGEEKLEEIQQAAAPAVENMESQATEAVANGADQTAAAAQCAENLANESQKQAEEVATSVVETTENSGAASKEYIVATAIQSSAEVEQAARDALQMIGQKVEDTKDCLIEKAQGDILEKGQQIQQEAEDSISALGQKINNAGQSVPETAAETMALTQDVSQKAIDYLQEAADTLQTGAEAAAEEAVQAANQQHQEASGLESLSEEQLKRPSSGAEAEPVPGIAEQLLAAGSALVQDSMHAGLQPVVQKGGELGCTNVDKMLEAVGGADGGAGEGGLDSSQNNATSFQPLSPGAAQEVQGNDGLSDISLDLLARGSEGDVLVGQGHSQVERKEEELTPTMRETCVRQTSMQEGEISPSDEVSYGDEGLLPPPPADFDEKAGLEDLPSPQPSESVPDEETLQRVAAQVTNQAVQEAIRMFTENGLGGITPTSDISSPASEPLSSPAPTNNLIDFNDAESSPLFPMSTCPPIVPFPPSPSESLPTAEPIPPHDDAESVPVTDVPQLPPSSGVVNSGLPIDSSNGSSEALI